MLKAYTYQGCSTCRAAVKWLRDRNIVFSEIPIRETPPSKAELKAALQANDGRLVALMNTSGQDYRQLGLKDRLPEMSQEEVLTLLAGNGNLVKRPFLADGARGVYLCGFRESVWSDRLAS